MDPSKVPPTHCRLGSLSYLLSWGSWEERALTVVLEAQVHLQDRVMVWHQALSSVLAVRL